MLKKLFFTAGFLLPWEFILTMGASGFFKNYLGGFYPLLTPQFYIPLLAIFYITRNKICIPRELLLMLALFFLIGAYEFLMTLFFFERIDWVMQELFFGFIGPILIILALSGNNKSAFSFFNGFYAGYVLYLLLALFFAIYDGIFKGLIDNYGFGGAIVSFRYQLSENNTFSLILGNANKQSNYILLLLCLGPLLMSIYNHKENFAKINKFSYYCYKLYFMISILIIILLFSRLAVFLLPLVFLINRKYLIRNRISNNVIYGILIFLIYLSYNYYEDVFNYLVYSTYIDGNSQGALGSMTVRFSQLDEIWALINESPEILITGIGVGGYGKLIGCESCGTHNLFADHLIASGLLPFLLLILIIAIGLYRALQRKNFNLIACYLIFIACAIREYSFSYLYLTSMGGMIFCFMLYATYSNDDLMCMPNKSPLTYK